MRLFSKTPKPNPKIIVECIEIAFHLKEQWWKFNYRGVDFTVFDLSLAMPTKAELDAILADLDLLKPEMRAKLNKGLAERSDSKVDVENFVATKTFSVEWYGGAS